MRAFGSAVESAVQRSGDRIGPGEIASSKFLSKGGSGTWIAPEDGVAHVFIWGAAGGSGNHPPGIGGATRKRAIVRKGDMVAFQIGVGGPGYLNGGNNGFTPGGDGGTTTVTLPDGTTLTATGGKANGPNDQRNGIGLGGEENRAGGSSPSFSDGDPVGTVGGKGSVAFAEIPGIGSRGGPGGWQVVTNNGGYYGGGAGLSDGFGATGGDSPYPPSGTASLKQPNGGNGAIYIDFVGAVP